MIVLLTALALAVPSTDLNGDGKKEAIAVTETSVTVGSAQVECGGFSACTVSVIDVKAGDRKKELMACDHGPRDDVACRLYHYTGTALTEVSFEGSEWGQAEIIANGSGIVRTTMWAHRLYQRVDKWTLKDGKLVKTVQSMYGVNETFHVDNTFKLKRDPNKDSPTVANTKPDSDITLLAEHATEEGWFLVMLSSRVTGWVHQSELEKASQQYIMMMQAG